MRFAAAALAAVIGPGIVWAEAPMAFLGGQGCTYGPGLRDRASAAGVDLALMDAAITAGLADGTATAQGDRVVFDASVCTIRLPDIVTDVRMDDLDIISVTSPLDAYAEFGEPGCYLQEPHEVFLRRAGGDLDAATAAFVTFVAAGIIAGDLRFYSEDILRTPPGFQVMTGDCGAVDGADAIRASHRFIAEGFGDYVRRIGAATVCDGPSSSSGGAIAAEIQGADVSGAPEDQPTINAWLFFEYELIALAAGWYEGMSGLSRGTPRPPLCHFP